jgi:hypothetical protein
VTNPDSKIRFAHDRRYNDSEFRMHVYSEIDTIKERQVAIEEKVDEVLSILRATKIGAWVIKWLAGIALTAVTVWTVWHDKRIP